MRQGTFPNAGPCGSWVGGLRAERLSRCRNSERCLRTAISALACPWSGTSILSGGCMRSGAFDDQKAVVAADEPLRGVVVVVGRDDVLRGRIEHCVVELEVDSQVISTEAAAALAEDLNLRLAGAVDCAELRVDLSAKSLPAGTNAVGDHRGRLRLSISSA